MKNYEILPCIDCRRCKNGDLVCKIKDEMQELYQKMHEADLVIFGTPLYWYGPTGKMKLFIDRMRPFISNGRLKGKRGVIAVPSEEGADACGPLMEMFSKSFDYLGMEFAGSILVKAYEKEEIKENREELERAYEFGKSL